MKKIVVFAITACSMLLCACDNKNDVLIEWVYTTKYIFQNNCSQTVTLSIHAINFNIIENEWREFDSLVFVIEPGTEYTKSTSMDGPFIDPLDWFGGHNRISDYTVVSYGDSEYTYYYKNNGDLYNLEKYELISESELERIYRYTFCDEDFE